MYSNKYILEYGNISGDEFKLLIAIRGVYENELIPISGYCTLVSRQAKNVFDPIRGMALNINLDANIEDPLNDFNDFDEFFYQVAFYRNDSMIFKGWVIPDGITQDYVKSAWTISLQAVDGLGFLKNYEFVDKVGDETLPPQEFNYLYAILQRLNLTLPLATYDDVNNAFTPDGTPFNQELTDKNFRIINKEVFLNKNGRYLDCETVLKDLLQKYNMCICQANVNGVLCWLVYRIPLTALATNEKGIVWRVDGFEENGQPIWARNGAFNRPISIIASDFDKDQVNYTAIHCNENQQIGYKSALQNVRFEQKWLNFLNKAPLVFDETTFDFVSGRAFMEDGRIRVIQDDDALLAVTQNPTTPLSAVNPVNLLINLNLTFEVTDVSDIGATLWTYVRVVATDGDLIQYLSRDGNGQAFWTVTPSRIKLEEIVVKNEGIYTQRTSIETPLINAESIQFIFYTGDFRVPDFLPIDVDFHYYIDSYDLFFSDPLLGIGEYHDCKRINFRSSFLEEPVKVINSNEPNNLFNNNLYRRVTGVLQPQNAWTAGNGGELYPDLLGMTSRERIDLTQRPQKVFSGDVLGYVPYFGLVNYYQLEGRFLPISYSYNTLRNVISLECQEVFARSIDKNYEKSYIFEDERNVLIKEL
jgi:hypothetical protein